MSATRCPIHDEYKVAIRRLRLTSAPCAAVQTAALQQAIKPLGDSIMSKRSISALSVALFGLALVFGAGSAFAGDGSSCGGKKKDDGGTAVVVMPELPRA